MMTFISQAKVAFIYLAICPLFAISLALPGFADGKTARPLRIELAYDVYLAGVLAGSVDLTITSDGNRYSIKSVSRSEGVLELLVNFRRHNDVLGQIAEHMAKPSRYAATGVWAGKARSVVIVYTNTDGLRFTAQPNASEDKREAVPANLLPGTTDPFSALYQAVLRYHDREKCDGRSEVFDGRRRYDFLFESVAGKPVEGPLYSGTAHVCRVRQMPIAGFSKAIWLPSLVRPEWTDIWLAKVRDDLPALPARLEADAGLGAMVAHLVAIGGRKQPADEAPIVTERPEDTTSRANPRH
jgi:hypothetical protein